MIVFLISPTPCIFSLRYPLSVISEESINSVLKLLENKLLMYQKISKEVSLLDALNELEVKEEETTKYLSSKYKDLLARENDIRKIYQSQPECLDRLYGK